MKKISLILLLLLHAVCYSQIINFPDINFKNRLLASNATDGYGCIGPSADLCVAGVIDTNSNGEIEVSEAQTVAILDVSGANIHDLTGIEYFTNLEWLFCGYNHLTSINVSQLTALTTLNCRNNQITSLDVTNLIHLKILGCNNNQLTSLDISHQPELEFLIASNNNISSLDFSNNPALQRAYCSNNLISSLDFSSNPNFFDLGCRNNPNLTTIKIRNNSTQLFGPSTFYNECWDNVPNLTYICADSNEIPALQSFLAGCGVTQAITIDSACPLGVTPFSANTIAVHPNPVTNILTIDFASPVTVTSSYVLYDVLGKKIVEGAIASGASSVTISFENYPKGVYLLHLKAGDKMISKKIIKE